MARALSNIRDDVRQIIGQPEASNSNFTNAQLNSWINEAYRNVQTSLESIPITERSYTTSSSISLNDNTVSIDTVKWLKNDGTNTEWIELEVIDIDTLARIDPDWENATVGTPKYAVRFGRATVKPYPPPDSDNDGQANGFKTYGLELATDLSSDSDTTNLPRNLDDILAHWAAYRCFERLGDGQRAGTEITIYRSVLKSQKKISTQFSRKRGRWIWG